MTQNSRLAESLSEHDTNSGAHFVPTPAQIRETCLAIQSGWTVAERRQRWCGPRRERWLPPIVAPAAANSDLTDDAA